MTAKRRLRASLFVYCEIVTVHKKSLVGQNVYDALKEDSY